MGKVSLRSPMETVPGPGVRLSSDKMEVGLLLLRRGDELPSHSHDEEETLYLEEGRLQVSLGEGEALVTYLVEPGQASFHPPGVPHHITAVKDTRAVCFKNLVEPSPSATSGRLG